ncbi:MAG TPA: glycosyltransferase family 4 protein [Xanthomonadales bacterium]|nr:glycosyltransferase family 4 protein [Xanthomonadales bacterium]
MTRQLNIVSVNQDRGISPRRQKGAAVHLRAMRRAFTQTGAQVSSIDEPDGVRVMFQLHGMNREKPIDLIYERYALGKSAAAEFARAHHIPYALEVNAPLAQEQSRWRTAGDETQDTAADRVTFGQADYILAVSTAVADYAARRGGRVDAIEVVPNGIDSSRFNFAARRDAGIFKPDPGSTFVLGFHGRERPWHGFDRLAELVRSLLDRDMPVHLKIIGKGDFDALKRLPEDAFTRLPWVEHDDLPSHLATMDAMPFCYSPDLPCYFSPLKLMEGMACGVVPLVPALGDLPGAVREGHDGLVYMPGDFEALQEMVISLIGDREQCHRMAINAAKTASRHDWTSIAEGVLENVFGRQVRTGTGEAASQVNPL